MIQLKKVMYFKIGNNTEGNTLAYKIYFGSVVPHFYFAAYIVPREESFDLFFVPQVNNLLDNGIVDMSDTAVNAVRGIAYGEEILLSLTNPHLDGYGRVIDVSLSLNERPVAVNSNSVAFTDIDAARATAREAIQPLMDIGLHVLANVVLIEVESKMQNIMQSSVGVSQDHVIPTIIKGILSHNKSFEDVLPSEMSQVEKDKTTKMFFRTLNVSPNSDEIPEIFADGILFARMLVEKSILIDTIPYEVLYRLMADWMVSKHSEQVSLLKKAYLAVVHTESISINMSTMEDVAKVYELLNKTQAFVYLTSIKIINNETSEEIVFPMDNEYYKNYIKTSPDCIEVKGIPSSNGTVLLQYGYGTGCDEFIGIFATTAGGLNYGLRRDDKMIGDEYLIARTWQWGLDKVVKSEGQIDSSGNITVEFTGV